jgi:hypothetical protein
MGTISPTRLFLPGARRSGVTWLVAPGLAMIAVTYGLARFACGLFLREIRESLDLRDRARVYRCWILRRLLAGDRRPRVHLPNRAAL